MGVRNGIPLASLLEELGLKDNPTRLRRRHLAENDWFMGERKKVYLTDEGERKIRIYAAAKDESPQVIQTFRTATVKRRHPNPAWVMVEVADDDGGSMVINCAIPRKLQSRIIPGKKIRVEIVTDGVTTTARHEHLAGF